MNENEVGLFLSFLEQGLPPHTAARRAGIRMAQVRKEYDADPVFRELYDDAREVAIDELETEARRRALEGEEELVYYQGSPVGSRTVYSDALMVQLLKGHRRQVFGDKREITGSGAITVVVNSFDDDEDDLSDVEI